MTVGTDVRRENPRSKRTQILTAAIDHFGKMGYEHTKWASIADEVGIGQTTLYHYFESKAHCPLTIMRIELADSAARFVAATEGLSHADGALRAAIAASLTATPQDALARRILHNHMDLLATERQSAKEEAERVECHALVQRIERDWTALVGQGIEGGQFAESNPRMSARLVLALLVSVWRSCRLDGRLTIDEITALVTDAAIRIVRK
ncbi:TetR family transcriptional regulator [Rhodococcus ruber]|uniref:TetR family transcriptional regulator n=1 Tax=Rhodococcus ruber TaxID=1830 RepID=A0ABT4MEN1_9NOCA|nr:TetR family transcriptional regulator [Rhodococcus ruber]MCZ4519449.1 TetR family transcriptional regulator [Rhodococcus ruber]